MSEPAPSSSPFYVTGGTLRPGTPSYVVRKADTELYERLLAGEFCYVLTPRQMGKSSLMARTAKRLETEGVRTVTVDLTQIGGEKSSLTPESWYYGVVHEIHRQLHIPEPLRPWWQAQEGLPALQKLTRFLRDVVLESLPDRVGIFVDEIDSTIGLPFADDFFAAIRACHNARATDPAFERLTFALFGVASPDQLIQDTARTPFNIGQRIELTDFTPDEAILLAEGLYDIPAEAERRLERILSWTSGHPYLTQALCKGTAESKDETTAAPEVVVDPIVEDLFLSPRAKREETNLKRARERLTLAEGEKRRLFALYLRVLGGKPVLDEPTSSAFAQLKLSGIVKVTEDGTLAVRNRIYERVFSRDWAESEIPRHRTMQAVGATLTASLLASLGFWYSVISPRQQADFFRNAIRDDSFAVAREAYKGLHSNPFWRHRADELMAEFWDRRASRYAASEKRDESLLARLEAISYVDTARRRKEAQHIVGFDYPALQRTVRVPKSQNDVFSPYVFSPDGKSLLMATNQKVELVSLANGQPLSRPIPSPNAFGIGAATFTHAGNSVVLSFDGSLRIDNRPQHVPCKTAFGTVLAVSPDDRTILIGGVGFIHLWKRDRRICLTAVAKGMTLSATFSPDGHAVLTTSNYGPDGYEATLWSFDEAELKAFPISSEEPVMTAEFGPDGKTVLTGDSEGVFKIWRLQGHSLSFVRTFQAASLTLKSAFSPDGSKVLTGSDVAQLWQADSGRPVSPPLRHGASIEAVRFTADGRGLLVASSNGAVRLWSLDKARPPATATHGNVNVLLSPDGKNAVSVMEGASTYLWRLRDGRHLGPLQLSGGHLLVGFSRDGKTLLAIDGANDFRQWKTATGNQSGTTARIPGPFQSAALSDSVLATLDRGGLLRVWDFTSGQGLRNTMNIAGSDVENLALSPDGRTLLTSHKGQRTRLWRTRDGALLKPPFEHKGVVSTLDFSTDGRFAFTGDDKGNVLLWDAGSGNPLGEPIRLQGPVAAGAFSPKVDLLLTINNNSEGTLSTVCIWRISDHKLIGAPLQIKGKMLSAMFDATEKSVLFRSRDWTHLYSITGNHWTYRGSRLVHIGSNLTPFLEGCDDCLQVARGFGDAFLGFEYLNLVEAVDPPLQGEPKALLKDWQKRLGLRFDKDMDLIPLYPPQEP